MTVISPSILACDFLHLEDEINRLNQTDCEWLHLDVMDGNFVNNITFGYELVAKIRPLTTKIFDTHLMVDHPLKFISDFANAGSDYITFHIECLDDAQLVINEIKKHHIKVGIAIKPNTPINDLIPFINDVDLVLVMSVEPGFGGQEFLCETTDKISEIKKLKSSCRHNFLISVDGGINNSTKQYTNDADVLVAGSYIFSGDYQQRIESLNE